MRIVGQINIKNIIVDKHSISPETFDLAFKLRIGELNKEDLPPIKVDYLDNGSYKLKDGRHRVTAFKLLGIESIKARYYKAL